MSAPYFSVVTPSFNQGEYIRACLQSVAGQGDDGYEHLVIDNRSTDRTSEEVARFPRACFRSEPDNGQSDAVNKGFRLAAGEILCWLNSDDAYPPGIFARLRQLFSDPAVHVVFGDAEQISYEGRGSLRAEARLDDRLDLVRWWSGKARIHQPATFFRRSVFQSVGGLRDDLHYAMDYEYWWRISGHFRFLRVPEVLAIQHRQPASKTVLNWQKVYMEREKIFSPYYHLVDSGNRRALMREKHAAMATRYLGEAFAVSRTQPAAALRLLARSLAESPRTILSPRWLGILRNCLHS